MRKKSSKWPWIVWLVFAVIAAAAYFVLTGFAVFPPAYKTLFLIIIAGLIVLGLLAVILTRGKGRGAAGIVCGLLAVLLIAGTVVVYRIDKKMQDIFIVPDNIVEIKINIYARKGEIADNDILAHKDAVFITQTAVDTENQEYALSQLAKTFGESPKSIQKEDLISAVGALLNREGDLLVMSEGYIPLLETLEGYEGLLDNMEVIYTVTKEEVKPPRIKTGDITKDPFTLYVGGFDLSSGYLTTYGRVDVNILLTINPVTKQILLVGIPRDMYVPNPALGYNYDKLTHLGWMNGITNSMEGVGKQLGIDIDHYVCVNFYTFQYLLDAIGGVDIENPYGFLCNVDGANIYFPEGPVHLDGWNGLYYVRERSNLSNGDYGRNAHQVLVLKAIVNKIMSKEILSRYEALLDALKWQFITDISSEDLIKLAVSQLDSSTKEWELITYSLGGEAAMQGTATFGWNMMLYTVNMFDSQRDFIKEQVDKLMRDDLIKQETLPDADNTTFIPN